MIHYLRAYADSYEQARASVDEALGYPSPEAETIWTPVGTALRDADGMCLLALWDELMALRPVSNAVRGFEEIDEATYRASLPTPQE